MRAIGSLGKESSMFREYHSIVLKEGLPDPVLPGEGLD